MYYDKATMTFIDDNQTAADDEPKTTGPLPPLAVEMKSPTSLLTWSRFDIYIKWAYARAFLHSGGVEAPTFATTVYTEHLAVMNGFQEVCKIDAAHATKCDKSKPVHFYASFQKLLLSMRENGYRWNNGSCTMTACGSAVPRCRRTNHVLQAAHRVASALALGLPTPSYTVDQNGRRTDDLPAGWKCGDFRIPPVEYSAAYFTAQGFHSVYADWVVHNAIRADPDLRVVHLWPKGVMRRQGGQHDLEIVRRFVAKYCSAEKAGGVIYDKVIKMSNKALHNYLRYAYGDVEWLDKKYESLKAFDQSQSYLYVLVVRSNNERMSECKAVLRSRYKRLYKIEAKGDSKAMLKHGLDFKATVHTTDTHSEAIVASQMLFHENSLAMLEHGPTNGTCRIVASQMAADLKASVEMKEVWKLWKDSSWSKPNCDPSFAEADLKKALFKCEASPDCVAITNITNKYRKSFWVCRASRERIDGKKGSAAYEKLSGEKAYPPRVESGHRREPWTHARDKTVHNKGAAPLHLIDEDILVDTGSAMGLLGLRTPTDVDIISQPGPFVPTLTREWKFWEDSQWSKPNSKPYIAETSLKKAQVKCEASPDCVAITKSDVDTIWVGRSSGKRIGKRKGFASWQKLGPSKASSPKPKAHSRRRQMKLPGVDAVAVQQLITRCPEPRLGAAPLAGCKRAYSSHSPPQIWFSFHNVSGAADLLDDPTKFAFCWGLKLLAPIQMTIYKEARLAWRVARRASGKFRLTRSSLSPKEMYKDRHDADLIGELQRRSCRPGERSGFCCRRVGAACPRLDHRGGHLKRLQYYSDSVRDMACHVENCFHSSVCWSGCKETKFKGFDKGYMTPRKAALVLNGSLEGHGGGRYTKEVLRMMSPG